jgi:hypothetical protein
VPPLGGQVFKTRAAAALATVCVSEPARQQAVAAAGILTALPEVVRDAYDSVQLFDCKLLAVFLEQVAWRRKNCTGIRKNGREGLSACGRRREDQEEAQEE